MSDLSESKLALFFPDYDEHLKKISSGETRFAYYTSADTAMKVIQNKEIWLRNTQGMNDFSEVEHGIESLRKAFMESKEGESFRNFIDSKFPGMMKEVFNRFDGWLPSRRSQTYIACVTVHGPCDDDYGRLSMWRAYGGAKPVALVFNSSPFQNDSSALNTTFYPVTYSDDGYVRKHLSNLEARMSDNERLMASLDSDELLGWLFELCKMMALCVKHPGFQEEQEWRLIYTPDIEQSPHVRGSIQTIDGVPQQIYKIKFENVPEENLTNATLPEFLDRVIIGPSDDAPLLIDSFCKILKEAGVPDPESKVHFSGIPLR
jgi:hypothetical protein